MYEVLRAFCTMQFVSGFFTLIAIAFFVGFFLTTQNERYYKVRVCISAFVTLAWCGIVPIATACCVAMGMTWNDQTAGYTSIVLLAGTFTLIFIGGIFSGAGCQVWRLT